jgi:phenylpyruvate C(3)-methyltransferase
MNHMMDDAWNAAARIFNSAVAASAISAAWELGVLDELNDAGTLDARRFAADRDLDETSTIGLLRALSAVDVVKRDEGRVTQGTHFAEIYRTRSFFHWLTRGSAELFREMPAVLRTENRVGDFYRRDAAAIAFACREMSEFCYDPWFWEAVDGLDFEVGMVADLGCGSGERIMQILRRRPGARGLGIDIARPALEMASATAREEGLADRTAFLEADVLTMEQHPEMAEVDLVTCFMMGHDFWPRRRCVDTLQRLRALFPKARRLVIGDATRTVGVADQDVPVFTLGFELAHDMMGTFIPTVADWESVFEDGGWVLLRKHWINLTVGEVIFELEQR